MTGAPVVVVHWERPATCAESVAGFLRQTVPCRVVVWDSASSDSARQELAERLAASPGVEIVWGTRNLGFAGAAAAGAERILGCSEVDLCLVAAQDARAEEHAVGRMVATLRSDTGLAVVFSRCEYDHVGIWSPVRGRRLVPAPVGEGDEVRRVLFATAACWALSRAAFERGVSVDPRIFLYGEECDLGLAARRAGLGAAVDLRARIWNGEPVGSGHPDLVAYLTSRNAVLLARKYAGHAASLLRAGRSLASAVGSEGVAKEAGSKRAARWRRRGAWNGLLGCFGSPPAELLSLPGESS